MDTQSLWIQDALREKRPWINKVPGTENPSDAMTKFIDGTTLMKTLNMMKCHFLEGRPESAPQLAEDAAGIDHLSAPERRSSALVSGSHHEAALPGRHPQRTAAQKKARPLRQQQHAAPTAAVSSGSKRRADKGCSLGNWRAWPANEEVGRWSDL